MSPLLAFIVRRLGQAILTVFGVMLLTFLLFRVIAGDVTAQYVGQYASDTQRDTWRRRHGLDRPVLINTGASVFEADFWDSQFVDHLGNCVTLRSRSYQTHERLRDIVAERAPYSLAIAVPALAIGWLLAMLISCLAVYHRNTWVDRVIVVVSVLGMCVPFLGYMIVGQWVMFRLAPAAAWGVSHRGNLYVPIAIAVAAGLGWSVRFYRTVIGEQIDQPYVRTARAKGASRWRVLLGHVLPNCMLPVVTSLAGALPYLIMGNLLLERFFGIPGLGELLLSSWIDRDIPVMTGLTFLTAVIYVLSFLMADVLYAAVDPRVRLR